MAQLRFESVSAPSLDARAVSLAFGLVARAQLMGLVPTGEQHEAALDREYLVELTKLLRSRGIATIAGASLARALQAEPVSDAELVEALRATVEALDSSPHPAGEWAPARELLGDELLARLLRVSPSSLRRYASAERRTPDEVAWRLHLVARLLAMLLGSYNDYGIRRWFERPRAALAGAAPGQVLEQADSEDDEQLQGVVALAAELLGPAAAA